MTADQIQFKQELGRLIRAMREQRGMTLKYVTDLIGVTFQQMQKLNITLKFLAIVKIIRYNKIR